MFPGFSMSRPLVNNCVQRFSAADASAVAFAPDFGPGFVDEVEDCEWQPATNKASAGPAQTAVKRGPASGSNRGGEPRTPRVNACSQRHANYPRDKGFR